MEKIKKGNKEVETSNGCEVLPLSFWAAWRWLVGTWNLSYPSIHSGLTLLYFSLS